MIRKINLTEDHLKLIPFICHRKNEKSGSWYIDHHNPYSLSGSLADIAWVLGYADKAIPGTEDDPEGAAFPDNVEQYLLSVHHYIQDNMKGILEIIMQYSVKGGVKAGEYKSIDDSGIWDTCLE